MAIELKMRHDEEKELKGGKRRYVDGDGHALYLTAQEVNQIQSASQVKVMVVPDGEAA